MPALDALTLLRHHAEWKSAYDRTFPSASAAAERLPLVRVVMPVEEMMRGSDHADTRVAPEKDDILRFGVLSPDHKSHRTAVIEARLDISGRLYFYGGRAHGVHGMLYLVFKDLPSRIEATPFGLGALFCATAPPARETDPCLHPIAHLPDDLQCQWAQQSLWSDEWRARTAEYLSLYFCDDRLSDYFAPFGTGRPRRRDPDGIFSDTRNDDWRLWTIEARVPTAIDILSALEDGSLLGWAIATPHEHLLLDDVMCGNQPNVKAPVWMALKQHQHLKIEIADTENAEYRVTQFIRDHVLTGRGDTRC